MKYLLYLFIVQFTASEVVNKFCTKDSGKKVVFYGIPSLEVVCPSVKIEAEEKLRLENQTSPNRDISYMQVVSSVGNFHGKALDLFPRLDFLLIYQSRVESFSIQSSIWHLDVSQCTFPNITRSVLKGVKSVRTLGFHSNPGLSFEHGAFRDLKSLYVLSIINQTLPSLQRKLLEGPEFLEQLILNLNGLKRVDDDAFGDLPNLEEINLDDNPLEYFKPNMSRLRNLRTLSLLNTKVKSFSPEYFCPLSSLGNINLPTEILLNLNITEVGILCPKLRSLGINNNDVKCPAVIPFLKRVELSNVQLNDIKNSTYLKNFERPSIC